MIDEIRIRRRLRDDFPHFAKKCCYIRQKDGQIRPLILNKAQLFIHDALEKQIAETGKAKALILKGRQQGASTYVEARLYWRVIHRKGTRVFLLTHEDAATQNLFEMVDRYHKLCPDLVRPHTGASNAKELYFDILDSGYKVGTAGSKAVGRSSTVQYFHGYLSPNTWIIDGETGGCRRMSEFAVGDYVRTHTGNIAPISFISRQHKPVVDVKLTSLTSLPLRLTKQHKVWTPDGMKPIGDLAVGDKVGFPVAEIMDDDITWAFRLPDSARPQGGGTREVGPDTVKPTYELGRILGLYLAEGHVKLQYKNGEPCAVLFSVHDREVPRTLEWLKPVQSWCRSIKVQDTEGSNGSTVNVYGRSFASFIHRLCGRVASKHVPVEWRRCGVEFARGLLHGYLAGDGHSEPVATRRISAPSIRPAITLGMRDIAASLGYGWATVEYTGAGIRHGRHELPQWTFRLCGPGVTLLAAELGWASPEPKHTTMHLRTTISDGYAWLPIASIEDAGEDEVMDFEVGHTDHSYETVHCAVSNSEVAFWPNAESHFAGVMQAVPNEPGTEIILESTANGAGGKFYELWQEASAGVSDFIPIFVPWYWQEEYTACATGLELTPEEKDLMAAYGLTPEQIAWRRGKVHELGQSLCDQEYPNTAEEAFILSGRCVFDAVHLTRAKAGIIHPIGRYDIINGVLREHSQGELRVWEHPKPGVRYAIGADVAEGLPPKKEGQKAGDFSVADVLEVPSGKQVAQWHGHIDPDLFGRVLYALGNHYNHAKVAVERNNHGHTTIASLLRADYDNIFVQRADINDSAKGTDSKYGFTTNVKTKAQLIDALVEEVRDGTHGICCEDTLREMRTFVIDEQAKCHAADGCYDDRVMARAIAGKAVRQYAMELAAGERVSYVPKKVNPAIYG